MEKEGLDKIQKRGVDNKGGLHKIRGVMNPLPTMLTLVTQSIVKRLIQKQPFWKFWYTKYNQK